MHTFLTLDPAVRVLWAKSGEDGGHGLLAHMLDVAAVAQVLLEYEPDSSGTHAAGWLGLDRRSANSGIAALAGLHDLGKATPGFQCKWSEGRDRDRAAGLPFPLRMGETDHALSTAAVLPGLMKQLRLPDLWLRQALQAISAHHGYNPSSEEIKGAIPARSPHGSPDPWAEARGLLFQAYWQTMEAELQPCQGDMQTAAVAWLAGLTSIADWVASNPAWFPQGERAESLREHFNKALALAAEALKAIGWPPYQTLLEESLPADEIIARMLGTSGASRPLQSAGDWLLGTAQGPALLLVEAPMGEGKTELALLAHLRLQRANRHRGLYFALPTQATGNAIFDRVHHFLKAFGREVPLDLQLVHGSALFQERVEKLRRVYDSSGEAAGAVESSVWFSQRKRPLLSPYGAGTIDQALLSTLNVKHHFVRLWGLTNRVVVLDEVHSYDVYTTGLIGSMLLWLKELGCSVVLMSATLPAEARRKLLEAWGAVPEALAEYGYPRLLLADREGVRGATFASRQMPTLLIRKIDEREESLVSQALQCMEGGGCGAIIVNTVDRAQRLYRLLQNCLEPGTELLLFHARYPADEREAREGHVLKLFGAPGAQTRRPKKALLIATQVAEQSLDIDFDFLITDLAPIDLILQRAGRLHRHGRSRPDTHSEARLYVAGLDPARMPETKTTGWEFVYDRYILLRTWVWLSRERELHMPEDIDRLVRLVYDGDGLPDELTDEIRDQIDVKAFGIYLSKRKEQRQKALNAAIDPRNEPQNAYLDKPRGHEEEEGLGIKNTTRLGDDAIGLVPVHLTSGGWSVSTQEPAFDPLKTLDDAQAKLLFSRRLRLNRKAVLRHFRELEAPPTFSEHPLLRDLKPLELRNGVTNIGTLVMRLDAELGLVFETTGSEAVTMGDEDVSV